MAACQSISKRVWINAEEIAIGLGFAQKECMRKSTSTSWGN